VANEKAPRKIAVFTGNRAEFGLLLPLLEALQAHPALTPLLWVGGEHAKSGTLAEIEALYSGSIDWRFEPNPTEMAQGGLPAWASAWLPQTQQHLQQAVQALATQNPDVLIILGDRIEAFPVAYATLFHPTTYFLHLGGGDWTEGGCPDDRLRYLLSELAHLHGCFTPSSTERLCQRGEEAWRLRCVGSPAVENALNTPLTDKTELCEAVGFDPAQPIALFTQHPVPDESLETTVSAFKASLEGLKASGYQVLATHPNRDAHGEALLHVLQQEEVENSSIHWVTSLGQQGYLNWLKACDVVVGNSSSGLYEAVLFGKPSLTLGNRQAGRERPANVLPLPYGAQVLTDTLNRLKNDTLFYQSLSQTQHPFGDGQFSRKLCQWLSELDLSPAYRHKRWPKT
jgi:UDP-hydrolysing UDP-N-acetyl-D-glucosamine 2-epimerase